MILEFFLALLAGIIAGVITGLLPGIHINLASSFIISSSALLLAKFDPITILIFIVAMSITHSFIDFIPGVFLGSPNEESGLSVLPGHFFLKKGRSFEAVIYSMYGGLIGIASFILLLPITIFIIPKLYPYLQSAMFLILLAVSLYMLLSQKNKSIAFFIFILSGFLGIASLNLSISQPLLPLLSGLFGGSSLVYSIINRSRIPPQKIIPLISIKLKAEEILSNIKALFLSAPVVGFLPGLGSGQAAVIGLNFIKENNRKSFLILLGSTNILILLLSFIGLYSIGRARSGSAAAIQEIINSINISHILIITAAVILSGIIAFFIGARMARSFSRFISKVNYSILSAIILLFVTIIVIYFSGIIGLIVFITSAFTGLLAISLNTRRTNLMGSLMIPTILFYLPF